MEFNIYKEKHI